MGNAMHIRVSTSWRLGALVAGLALSCAAIAQTYPARPVAIVVTLPPGSTVDSLARVFGQQLAARLKESVVVENKAGAGLMLGMQAVANAPADGHMLAFTPVTPLSIQTHRHKNAGYALESFVPLCQTFENIFFLAVSAKSDARDAKALIARLKKEPGKFSYGHSGAGSAPHLMAEDFWRDLGVTASDVPYRGETAFLPDLIAGSVEGGMVTTTALQQHRFRPLVVFSTTRSKAFPDVPTAAELGAKVPPSGYGGLFVRKDTPPEVVTKLEGMCREIVASPAYQLQAEALQQNATYLDRAAFSERLAADHQSKGKLLSVLKIKD
jgi:tripartite-type tricarboxylate transporter receptor subunit TctC